MPEYTCLSREEEGSSDDVINVVDGVRDTVNCGVGDEDVVRVDSHDEFEQCELVVHG